MSAITTHVLDTSRGRPAEGVPVRLEIREAEGDWQTLGTGATDRDGRLRTLMPPDSSISAAATYRLTFDTEVYFRTQNVAAFFPSVVITFTPRDASSHYHVPLLLSPFGYSTYRGS